MDNNNNTLEAILNYARLNYPKGTKFRSPFNQRIRISSGIIDSSELAKSGNLFNRLNGEAIRHSGEWADILSKKVVIYEIY